jgi:hypothetical protein
MQEYDQLLTHIPIGCENAITSRAIWQSYGVWVQGTIEHWLRHLIATELVCAELQPWRGKVRRVFWRE